MKVAAAEEMPSTPFFKSIIISEQVGLALEKVTDLSSHRRSEIIAGDVWSFLTFFEPQLFLCQEPHTHISHMNLYFITSSSR